MDSVEKLERILGREDWQTLTQTQLMQRALEIEQVAAFVRKLRWEMRRRHAATVGAVLSLNGNAEN